MTQTGIENRGIDPELFNKFIALHKHSPVFQSLGFDFIYLGEGCAGIRMRPHPRYSSYPGRVNGGIIAALADNTMGMAAMTLGSIARTVDINLNYFAPVYDEVELKAEGYVVNPGKTIIVAEANLFNDSGKLVAKSHGTFIRDSKIPFSVDAIPAL